MHVALLMTHCDTWPSRSSISRKWAHQEAVHSCCTTLHTFWTELQTSNGFKRHTHVPALSSSHARLVPGAAPSMQKCGSKHGQIACSDNFACIMNANANPKRKSVRRREMPTIMLTHASACRIKQKIKDATGRHGHCDEYQASPKSHELRIMAPAPHHEHVALRQYCHES